jgi:hypothetical protein
MKKEIFTEIGFDPDNNKYFLGVSSEVEYQNGTEFRKTGFIKMEIKGFYFRIWLLKAVVGFSIPGGFFSKRKNRHNFKFVFGLNGIKHE